MPAARVGTIDVGLFKSRRISKVFGRALALLSSSFAMTMSVRRIRIRQVLLSFALLVLFRGTVEAGTVKLAWDPNAETDLAGYIVHYGTASGVYTNTIDVGYVTAWTVTGLTDGRQYFF